MTVENGQDGHSYLPLGILYNYDDEDYKNCNWSLEEVDDDIE